MVTGNSLLSAIRNLRKNKQKQTNGKSSRNLKNNVSRKWKDNDTVLWKKVWKIGDKSNLYKLDNVSENIPKVGEEEMFGRGRFMLPFISLFTFWLIYLAYASVFLFCFYFLFDSFAILFLFRSLVPFPRLYLCLICQSFFVN